MANPIEIAVVGHTNAGKTSLLRTLTRRETFGDVSPQPGTTRHVEEVALLIDGECVVRFFDTPGLEDSVALLDYLNQLDGNLTRPDKVRGMLKGPEASRSFEQEAKVLRKLLDVDAAFYVIDCREPVLPKFRAEMEILTSCAKPVMPILNFVRHPASRDDQWQDALAAHGLHAMSRFDVVAPFTGSEQQIYRDLIALLRSRESQLTEIIEFIELERLERRAAALQVIASTVVSVAALRRTATKVELAKPATRQEFVMAFRAEVVGCARRGVDELLEIYAFRRDDADVGVLPWLDERWEADLFNPEVLRAAGVELGAGAAVGASIGLATDLALAGLSLGIGTAIGTAVGGALSQGFGRMGRILANKVRGLQDLTVQDEVLQLLGSHLLGLLCALEQRGHAAIGKVQVDAVHRQQYPLRKAIESASAARGRPDWYLAPSTGHKMDRRRDRLVAEISTELRSAMAAVL